MPFPPGGSTDLVARLLAEGLSNKLSQTTIVENRAGAGGAVGTQHVTRADADGYTLLFTVAGPITLIPQVNKSVNYDISDLDPVAIVFRSPMFLAVAGDSKYSDVRTLLEDGKLDEKTVPSYGSSGVGALSHVASEMLNDRAGTSFLHIPYKGTPMTIQGILAGDVTWGLITGMDAKPYFGGGTAKGLAVLSKERSPMYPEIPTMNEAGVDDLDVDAWFGLFAPKGMPAEITAKLNKATLDILKSPEFSGKIEDLGGSVPLTDNTPELIRPQLQREYDTLGAVIEAVGISN